MMMSKSAFVLTFLFTFLLEKFAGIYYVHVMYTRISFLRVAAHSGPAGKTVTRVIAEILAQRELSSNDTDGRG